MLGLLMGIPKFLLYLFSIYLTTTISIFRYSLPCLLNIRQFSVITVLDMLISLYFRLCGLSPRTIDLDDQTTMHFWVANHYRFDKPSLVLIHGYGGNSRWQFISQVASLSQSFNLYIPDLLFFGKSYTKSCDRTEIFQAKCVGESLLRLGVFRYSIYGISYGGFVGFSMAEMYPKEVQKIVIVSSGIGGTKELKQAQINKIGRNPLEILVPEKAQDLRLLVNLSVYNCGFFKLVPDYLLNKFINAMFKEHKKEKIEMAEHLLIQKPDPNNLPILTQESLIIWGDKDNIFPLCLAHQLQRHLGPKSRLEIIKDMGHAANLDSPSSVNALIKSFVLGLHSC